MGAGMLLLQDAGSRDANEAATVGTTEAQGLVGWVLELLRGRLVRRVTQRNELRLVETLSLGGKRQLMLVTCAGESFLVGGGLESVETIVRVKAETSLGVEAKSTDETCR
jgi:flagellar biogenesis protein FliO